MNELERVIIWKFDGAPAILKSTCRIATKRPEWLLLIPISMSAIDDVICAECELDEWCRYETKTGIVYTGSSPIAALMTTLSRVGQNSGEER